MIATYPIDKVWSARMDEVKGMTNAGETVNKAVETGLRTLRRGAARAGQAGLQATARAAAATEHKLTEHGADPQRLAEAAAENVEAARQELGKASRRARKKIERNAKHTRKDLARGAKKARKDTKRAAKKGTELVGKLDKKAAKAAKKASRRDSGHGRRWPWLLGLGVLAAGATYVLRSRQQTEGFGDSATVTALDADRSASNGTAPSPRRTEADDPARNRN